MRIIAQGMCRTAQGAMDWDNLKVFLAFAEAGSLSRASAKLRVDHSTIARRIDRPASRYLSESALYFRKTSGLKNAGLSS